MLVMMPTRNAQAEPGGTRAPSTRGRLRRGRGARGLTLLELIIAIAIVAILAAIAVPSMQSMIARNRLKAAANAIAEDLRWTRSESIKQNRALQLSLNPGPWCYGVGAERALGCDCRDTATPPGACELKRVSGDAFPGVSLSATFSRTVFEPRRATAVNGSLVLTSAHGLALKVVLSRLGRVRLCSPNADLPGYEPCSS